MATSDAMLLPQFAFGARTQGLQLELIPFRSSVLGDNEVFVDIAYCGMCHSVCSPWASQVNRVSQCITFFLRQDLHKICNDWNDAKSYPMVK